MKTPGALSLPPELSEALADFILKASDKFDAVNGIRDFVHKAAPNHEMPVDNVRWVPIEMVTPNDYNPNHVAKVEMGLLLRSIMHDGYTQPVVTVWNPDKEKFEIVDGFHRYFTMRSNKELLERCHGRLPIVVIDKPMNDRMASTVRHNRARGKHSVNGMANMVFSMLENGMADADICNELGMEAEELIRLKHITGFSKLFKDTQYNRAWVTKNQIRLKLSRGEAVTAAERHLVGLTPDRVIVDEVEEKAEETAVGNG